jgi:large subunit ribosomal protein L4
MAKIDVYSTDRKKVGKLDLSDAVFGVEVKDSLLFAAVRYQLAKKRSGTHKIRSRSEVRGGGAKPFRQKGTGRARQGTTRAPHMRGGGVVHGPLPRNHGFKLNRKVRAAALRCALSRRAEEKALVILDDIAFGEIKTKNVVNLLKTFELTDALFVVDGANEILARSASNLQEVTVLEKGGVNVVDVLRRRNLVMTKAAVESISARLQG